MKGVLAALMIVLFLVGMNVFEMSAGTSSHNLQLTNLLYSLHL